MKERRKSVSSFCSSLVEKRILDESKCRQKGKITTGSDRTFSSLLCVTNKRSFLRCHALTGVFQSTILSPNESQRSDDDEFFSTDLRMAVLFIITVNRIEQENPAEGQRANFEIHPFVGLLILGMSVKLVPQSGCGKNFNTFHCMQRATKNTEAESPTNLN